MNDQQRAAMQMALIDLEHFAKEGYKGCLDTITALREALSAFSTETCSASAQPQGEWVDLTDDEVADLVSEKAMDMRMTYQGFIREVIAKFKEKNTPPVVPQGEPVAWGVFVNGVITCVDQEKEPYTVAGEVKPLYTTPPFVEAAVLAERESCAKLCEELGFEPEAEARCAAAIRSMK